MAVKIKRERPDQRRHHRVSAPLFVAFDGHRIKAADWSLGGLRVVDFPGTLPAIGTEIQLQLTLPFQGFDVTFEAKADVVRFDATTSMFACRFTEIGERERELMSHFLEELVRGSMSEVEDTIQRIDVPVTPASLQPDVNPLSKLPIKRWPVKTLAMSGVYAVLGLVIFGYTALLSYSNFFRMEVQTAVITAPVEIVAAQADGHVKWLDVKPGDHIRAGTPIVNLIDSQLQREIELAEIAVQERKAKLGAMKRRHLDELERVRGYATVEMKNIQQTRLEIEALAAQLAIAQGNELRLRGLHSKGFATESKLEEARRQVITLGKELEIRRVEIKARIELSEQNVGKRMYTGHETIGSGDLFGKIGEIESDIRLNEHEIELAQQRYIAYLRHRDSQSVRAPFDGIVLELPRLNDGSVRRGDTIAIIEQRDLRQVTAFLNQDEVLKIGLGDEATLYVPALGETMKAKVAKIDRTTGFIQEHDKANNPGYRWRGPVDRSAKVTLQFADTAKVRDSERYRSGLPVVVVFPQRSTNSLLSSIRQRFSLAL
ncbi:MAG: HlyD family efflux transporter periplasmic adaptor subunit [Hyphomicrobiaceae bacterium]